MLNDLINQLIEIRRQRTELAVQDKALVLKATTLEGDIMHAMTEAGTFRASSEAGHSVNMVKKMHPAISDWAEFYKYVSESGSFDLLQKRLSSTAFKDRWNSGAAIPGATSAEVWELSITTSRK